MSYTDDLIVDLMEQLNEVYPGWRDEYDSIFDAADDYLPGWDIENPNWGEPEEPLDFGRDP